MTGCEGLVRDLLIRGGYGALPGRSPTRGTRQGLMAITLVTSGLQTVAMNRFPTLRPSGPDDELVRLCRKLLQAYDVGLERQRAGLRLVCRCGLGEGCWLQAPHDDARYDEHFAVHRQPADGGPTAFPPGSPADGLLWSHEPRHAYAQEALVRLLEPLARRHPDGADLARWLRLNDPRTVVAVGLEGGGETMRFVYELVGSFSSGNGEPPHRVRREFSGGADAAATGSHLAARRAFDALARVRSEQRVDVGRSPHPDNGRKRVELVVVAALAAVHVDNLDEVTAAVRDVMRDTAQRGWVLVVNDNLPPLLPDALTGLADATPQLFGKGAASLTADHADIAVKIGTGTVLHALGIGDGVVRVGGAEFVLSDEGGGFQIALQALRRTMAYLQGVVLRPSAAGSVAADELAAEAGKFVGVDARHWRGYGGRTAGGDDDRLTTEERIAVLDALGRASAAWAQDRSMKRRVAGFATVVCWLADQGNPDARAVVRDAASQIADLIEAAVRARCEARPGLAGSIVVLSGKIPSRCRTFNEAVRKRMAQVASTERHALRLHVITETTVCALATARWLHDRLRSGAPIPPGSLLDSRLIRVSNTPIRSGALG